MGAGNVITRFLIASRDAVTGLFAVDDGQPQHFAGDELGRLWVRVVPGAPSPAASPTLYSEFGTTTAASIEAVPATVLACQATNRPGAALRYLQLFNKAAVPVANDVPIYSFMIPLDEGEIIIGTDFFTVDGKYFATGLGFAISSDPTKYDATGVVATEHEVHVHYYL